MKRIVVGTAIVAIALVLVGLGVVLGRMEPENTSPSIGRRDPSPPSRPADRPRRDVDKDDPEKTTEPEVRPTNDADTHIADTSSPEPSPPDESLYEEFQQRFRELAQARKWGDLEKHIYHGLETAKSLKEFLPILIALLESLGNEVGYSPVGRGVQSGMFTRSDLKENAGLLNSIFISTESHVVRVGLAGGPIARASEGRNTTTLVTHVERWLLERDRYTRGLSEVEAVCFWDQLLGAHIGLSKSILDTIKYVDILRKSGLTMAQVRELWSYCRSSFYYKQYAPGDVPEITEYLIAHTDESILASAGSDKEVNRLKKIWENFREQYAYDAALKHVESTSDQYLIKGYDAILAHWLAKKE